MAFPESWLRRFIVRFIETARTWHCAGQGLRRAALVVVLGVLSACQLPPQDDMPKTQAAAPVVPTAVPTAPAAQKARNMLEYRILAAQRIREFNPQLSFDGPLPDPLSSIPVLQVHLNRDGTVQKIDVMRTPRYRPESIELAKRAVLQAQPFGPVGHLPKPWQFNETFLFNHELKFQLHTLVEIASR
jgi:hypothetical protein